MTATFPSRSTARNQRRSWRTKARSALARTKPAGRQAEACFALSGPGVYAVAVYHDANDNHHFDRTFLGLPAEGYGFSNDAPTPIGPPPFSAAKFIVPPGGTTISIHLRY